MSGIKHWLTPDWPAPANVHAATTLRSGGISCGAYTSLNPAMHVGDDVGVVKQNRQTIKESLGLPGDPVWLDQIHSNRAVPAVTTESLQQADASYTAESGVVCAVLTADCLPLLVCAVDGSWVAAIHAGWRGLLAGVIGNTVSAMQNSDLLVWLGPAIGPDCFEVGAEVRDAFLQKSAAFSIAFKPQNNGKWLADIYQLARIDLSMMGLNIKVYGGGFCTVTEQERFYSYRRDKQTGRMATLIWRE
ncbi:peptidoglycan editing factor PgeF [Methylobacter sp. Wu8]|uniref:peptidoglycan editing factor PgeF n=1 Tax=Methylobacter sp. Wu8 TaxID=3118457 RepID=UPI002F2E2E46